MKNSIILFAALLIISFTSCNKKENTIVKRVTDSISVKSVKKSNKIEYNSSTINEVTANKLKEFISANYLKPEDLKILEPNDRKFSFYEIDLNSDNKVEYFVNLQGNYFRGSGGGTFLLLSNDMKIIDNFTVMNEPIFRSNQKTNGWNDIILIGDYDENGGAKNFLHLKYDKEKRKYPSNPSLIKKIKMAPSGSDFSMWNKEFSMAKVFEF
ncbi:hypothetical protein G6N05_04140 [Flavobacterium sp. F372]|jgi:hypothetical protein|uniref:Lipoprotein n=1 Tax=Flavobacterium bernardetii TaxID=2813823 RepID=A0ABR7IWA0_9FLAO|nr:hypothetical protein [Flavobacterium bernardetii]MBC5834066.1 hypothetical protein [Flavobacterium bernardetii]NHF69298.1 hypothetical protein [Flavobacterium bernardetii]